MLVDVDGKLEFKQSNFFSYNAILRESMQKINVSTYACNQIITICNAHISAHIHTHIQACVPIHTRTDRPYLLSNKYISVYMTMTARTSRRLTKLCAFYSAVLVLPVTYEQQSRYEMTARREQPVNLPPPLPFLHTPLPPTPYQDLFSMQVLRYCSIALESTKTKYAALLSEFECPHL